MSSSTKNTSTQSNTVDPSQMAQYQANYAGTQAKAATMTPYTGQLTAPFNPTQTQAQGILSSVATDPQYAAANNNAMGTVQGILSNPVSGTVTPTPVSSTPLSASTYNPAQLAGVDLTKYEDPFTQQVINTTNNAIGLQRQTANMQDNQEATAAGAFGGSRSGVANALTNQYYDQDTAATDAGLNEANFTQAQNAAIGDINAQNASKQFNAGQTQNAGIFNSTQGLAANEFNSGQNMTAQQQSITNALASQGLQLNAAGQLVSTNNNGLALAQQQGGILSAVGDAQQQQSQTELANAYNAFLQGQQLTMDQQQLLNQALGIIPVQQTTNGTSTTTQNPGVTGILGSLGSLAMAAAMPGSAGLTSSLSGLFGGSGNAVNVPNGPMFGAL